MLHLAVAVLLANPIPLTKAHAHNDYAQTRPLHGALELGFCSIEADVFLVHGKLLVGHDREDLQAGRDLESLYLKPLAAAAHRNGGNIYKKAATVNLLIDIKADGTAVYEVLKRQLEPYRNLLTSYRNGKVEPRAITVVLSGDRPTSILAGEKARYAFIDGRPENLDRHPHPSTLMPLISASWPTQFSWFGQGPMPALEREKLMKMSVSAHLHGQKLRFWATPENPAVWDELLQAGVDFIGTDRQQELASYLRYRKSHQ